MALYEHVFLARQDITPQQIDQMIEQYRNVIEENGGQVVSFENWGLRSLSYRIKKNRKAYYVFMNINASANILLEVERQMRINEDIIRFLSIRVKAHENLPANLQRRDREERVFKEDEPSRRLRDQTKTFVKGEE
ncbi:MAG: small subunit ribosomal protein S6 [Candidatus Tokpelaia sp. JSC161]|nr:MAG: small subunit ribosomal protein S6 [Candidatus Tokpelaia sp. JSC161]